MKNDPKVIREISPNDGMFKGNLEHYFAVGESAIICIQNAMKIANKNVSDIKKILDFPSGYGRVLRNLKARFPNSQITACDINRNAVDFCEKTFVLNPSIQKKKLNKSHLKINMI